MATTNINPFGNTASLPQGYPIKDDLETDSAQWALSARQGKRLKGMIDDDEASINAMLGLIKGGDVTMTTGKYIPVNQGVGEVCPMELTAGAANDCAIINMLAGQKLEVIGVGGNASRLWAVIDKTTHVIKSVADANTITPDNPFKKVITAKEDCIVVVNVYNSSYKPSTTVIPYANASNTPYSVKLKSLNESMPLSGNALEIFEETRTAPDTAVGYHALWDDLVTAGLVERSTIANPNNKPVYLYRIAAYNKISKNPDNTYNFDITDNDYFEKKKVLITTGIHGYERNTPMYVFEFFNRILTDDRFAGIRSGYEWYVIPLVNPNGFDNNVRNNHNDVDINRDFIAKSQVETQAICDLIDNNDFVFYVDMHQSGAGRSQYTPNLCSTIICPGGATAAELQKICTPYYRGAAKADALFNEYFGKSVAQTGFAWPPVTVQLGQQQSHDYGYTHGITESIEFEFSQYCYAYSGSDVKYNPASYIVGNTLLHYLMLEYFGN